MSKLPNTFLEYNNYLENVLNKIENEIKDVDLKNVIVKQLTFKRPKDENNYNILIHNINEMNHIEIPNITYFNNNFDKENETCFYFYTKERNNNILFKLQKCTINELILNQNIFINKIIDKTTIFPEFNLN